MFQFIVHYITPPSEQRSPSWDKGNHQPFRPERVVRTGLGGCGGEGGCDEGEGRDGGCSGVVITGSSSDPVRGS